MIKRAFLGWKNIQTVVRLKGTHGSISLFVLSLVDIVSTLQVTGMTQFSSVAFFSQLLFFPGVLCLIWYLIKKALLNKCIFICSLSGRYLDYSSSHSKGTEKC